MTTSPLFVPADLIPPVHHQTSPHRRPARRPGTDGPPTMLRTGTVVALRERDAIALGSLSPRTPVRGDRLVCGSGVDGQSWWIPAEAVWSDAATPTRPEQPRPAGLATAATRDRALLAGLSDRLGWEALLHLERGEHLPPALGLEERVPDQVVVLDGRIGHEIPTVVVLGPGLIRWGAGTSWDGAVRRALYGDDGHPDVEAELAGLASALVRDGLDVVAVDLDSPLLRRAGIVRCSVQLVATNVLGR